METVILYRPVGQAELDLIKASNYTAFPPRLAHQPIFYPVVELEYALKIARDWNTKDEASGYVGYVTRFKVKSEFLNQYPRQSAGGKNHTEYWIPAEQLPAFNANLVGPIEVVTQFVGSE